MRRYLFNDVMTSATKACNVFLSLYNSPVNDSQLLHNAGEICKHTTYFVLSQNEFFQLEFIRLDCLSIHQPLNPTFTDESV